MGMGIKSLDLTRGYVGKQETTGANRGPVIDTIAKALNVPLGVSWCAQFVTWILMRAYGMDKSTLRKKLGFDSPWYCDSTKDWRAQAMRHGMMTDSPTSGDLFILLNESGEAHHIGFVVTPPDATGRFQTNEGNTNSGGSVNGDGVYNRTRTASASVVFIELPWELKQ